MRTAVFLMANMGRFCVLRSKWDERLAIPHESSADPNNEFNSLLILFLVGYGWKKNEIVSLGPDRHRFVTEDFYFFIEGARGGIAPGGWTMEWVYLKQIKEWLREGRFENPDQVDRALSLFERYHCSLLADAC